MNKTLLRIAAVLLIPSLLLADPAIAMGFGSGLPPRPVPKGTFSSLNLSYRLDQEAMASVAIPFYDTRLFASKAPDWVINAQTKAAGLFQWHSVSSLNKFSIAAMVALLLYVTTRLFKKGGYFGAEERVFVDLRKFKPIVEIKDESANLNPNPPGHVQKTEMIPDDGARQVPPAVILGNENSNREGAKIVANTKLPQAVVVERVAHDTHSALKPQYIGLKSKIDNTKFLEIGVVLYDAEKTVEVALEGNDNHKDKKTLADALSRMPLEIIVQCILNYLRAPRRTDTSELRVKASQMIATAMRVSHDKEDWKVSYGDPDLIQITATGGERWVMDLSARSPKGEYELVKFGPSQEDISKNNKVASKLVLEVPVTHQAVSTPPAENQSSDIQTKRKVPSSPSHIQLLQMAQIIVRKNSIRFLNVLQNVLKDMDDRNELSAAQYALFKSHFDEFLAILESHINPKQFDIEKEVVTGDKAAEKAKNIEDIAIAMKKIQKARNISNFTSRHIHDMTGIPIDLVELYWGEARRDNESFDKEKFYGNPEAITYILRELLKLQAARQIVADHAAKAEARRARFLASHQAAQTAKVVPEPIKAATPEPATHIVRVPSIAKATAIPKPQSTPVTAKLPALLPLHAASLAQRATPSAVPEVESVSAAVSVVPDQVARSWEGPTPYLPRRHVPNNIKASKIERHPKRDELWLPQDPERVPTVSVPTPSVKQAVPINVLEGVLSQDPAPALLTPTPVSISAPAVPSTSRTMRTAMLAVAGLVLLAGSLVLAYHFNFLNFQQMATSLFDLVLNTLRPAAVIDPSTLASHSSFVASSNAYVDVATKAVNDALSHTVGINHLVTFNPLDYDYQGTLGETLRGLRRDYPELRSLLGGDHLSNIWKPLGHGLPNPVQQLANLMNGQHGFSSVHMDVVPQGQYTIGDILSKGSSAAQHSIAAAPPVMPTSVPAAVSSLTNHPAVVNMVRPMSLAASFDAPILTASADPENSNFLGYLAGILATVVVLGPSLFLYDSIRKPVKAWLIKTRQAVLTKTVIGRTLGLYFLYLIAAPSAMGGKANLQPAPHESLNIGLWLAAGVIIAPFVIFVRSLFYQRGDLPSFGRSDSAKAAELTPVKDVTKAAEEELKAVSKAKPAEAAPKVVPAVPMSPNALILTEIAKNPFKLSNFEIIPDPTLLEFWPNEEELLERYAQTKSLGSLAKEMIDGVQTPTAEFISNSLATILPSDEKWHVWRPKPDFYIAAAPRKSVWAISTSANGKLNVEFLKGYMKSLNGALTQKDKFAVLRGIRDEMNAHPRPPESYTASIIRKKIRSARILKMKADNQPTSGIYSIAGLLPLLFTLHSALGDWVVHLWHQFLSAHFLTAHTGMSLLTFLGLGAVMATMYGNTGEYNIRSMDDVLKFLRQMETEAKSKLDVEKNTVASIQRKREIVSSEAGKRLSLAQLRFNKIEDILNAAMVDDKPADKPIFSVYIHSTFSNMKNKPLYISQLERDPRIQAIFKFVGHSSDRFDSPTVLPVDTRVPATARFRYGAIFIGNQPDKPRDDRAPRFLLSAA